MTELSAKVKTALDETRMLILGSQVLIGFQFRAVFQDAFEQLPEALRHLDAVALVLMLAAAAFLIAPGLYHRIVEQGEDSTDIHRFVSLMACLALLPFALSLGLDIFIAIERVSGRRAALLAGCTFGLLALWAWYGIEILHIRKAGQEERAMARTPSDDPQPTPLHTRIEQMLTEARVILPGAQAMLGFQLAITITKSFDTLDPVLKLMHAISLGLLALTVILLMFPAAYHRIVYAGEDTEEFHRTGSAVVTAATLPLALGLGCDVYVVITRIFESSAAGVGVALATTAAFMALWYVYPLVVRWRRRADGRRR
jgi:hypothetical protein